MQAVFGAHRKHPGSAQTHQGEEAQEEHHGWDGITSPPLTILLPLFHGLFFLHQEKQEENELRALPPASAAHLRALDVSIRRTARQNGVSREDLQVRKAVVARMEELVRRHLPACSLRLYGSTLTQFAFRSSDVNVDVRHPPSVGLLP